MDFLGPEPRPARKLAARTWPPPRPPYPSRRRLAELATPVPVAAPGAARAPHAKGGARR